MADNNIVVIGAGPAGIRAAEAVVEAGLRPILIDEERRDGGQIYRRQPNEFRRVAEDLYGTEADRAKNLHATFDALRPRIDYRPETLAWNIADNQVHVVRNAKVEAIPFKKLIIASGATDRLMPVRGWHRAGVYSLGGAQIALKSQACSIGRNVVFLGTGPLLYLVASQYAKAGATVAAVLDTSSLKLRLRALPKLAARPGFLMKGIRLVQDIKRRGIRLHSGVTPLEINGDAATGVQSVKVRLESGDIKRIDCDAVALGYHLRPETQLADLARCTFAYDPLTRQWFPKVDAEGRSSVEGVYLAGDGCRILGADGAESAGRLAALSALKDSGHAVSASEMARLMKTASVMGRFSQGMAKAFPWPHKLAANLSDDTVVCRCETVTAGELRSATRDKGADEVNRAKAFSRVGMGRCQGRFCANAATEVIAGALGVSVEDVGRLRGQAPVKPLPIASVGGLP